MTNWPKRLLTYSLGAALGYQGIKILGRKFVKDIANDSIRTIMTDIYDENLWEFVSATTKFTPQVIVETNLRTQEGKAIKRPLGSPKQYPSIDQLMFNFAQLEIMPTPLDTPVETKVIIGKTCKKPLVIDIPVMIGGMSYGSSITEQAKIALAKGSRLAGIATNTGEGPFLKSERKAAEKLILQYNKGNWNKSEDILKQVDAIEIQIGQGATGGVGHKIQIGVTDFKLQKAFGVFPGQDAVLHSRHEDVNHPSQLAVLVQRLRSTAGDIPVGIKICPSGKYFEKDLEWAIKSDVNFIVVDGAEAGSAGSSPTLQDNFGLPIVFGVYRAAEFLRKHQLQDKISLIASGKIRTPGEVMKVLALGADAAYIGGIALFAMSHTQVLKALPYEPPTQLIWYNGKYSDEFDVETGAKNLSKFLKSLKEELVEGVRALGKTSISQINKEDLFALDELTAKGIGIPMVYKPYQ